MKVMQSLFVYAQAVHSMIHRWKYSLKRGNKSYLCSTSIAVGVIISKCTKWDLFMFWRSVDIRGHLGHVLTVNWSIHEGTYHLVTRWDRKNRGLPEQHQLLCHRRMISRGPNDIPHNPWSMHINTIRNMFPSFVIYSIWRKITIINLNICISIWPFHDPYCSESKAVCNCFYLKWFEILMF